MVANPFGENAFTKGTKSRVPVAKGETFRLRFGAWIYSHRADQTSGIGQVWEGYARLGN